MVNECRDSAAIYRSCYFNHNATCFKVAASNGTGGVRSVYASEKVSLGVCVTSVP